MNIINKFNYFNFFFSFSIVNYCTFVQFYDTFTDFEDGNEMGDVTIDTVYKQWTIDTNRVSFIKNFLGLKKGNDPNTVYLEGWWNAFGAQLYYSSLINKEDQ